MYYVWHLEFACLGVQREGIKQHRADEGDVGRLAEGGGGFIYF